MVKIHCVKVWGFCKLYCLGKDKSMMAMCYILLQWKVSTKPLNKMKVSNSFRECSSSRYWSALIRRGWGWFSRWMWLERIDVVPNSLRRPGNRVWIKWLCNIWQIGQAGFQFAPTSQHFDLVFWGLLFYCWPHLQKWFRIIKHAKLLQRVVWNGNVPIFPKL